MWNNWINASSGPIMFKNITGNKACDSCDACKFGKMHKLHFPIIETKTKHPLEILHTDL